MRVCFLLCLVTVSNFCLEAAVPLRTLIEQQFPMKEAGEALKPIEECQKLLATNASFAGSEIGRKTRAVLFLDGINPSYSLKRRKAVIAARLEDLKCKSATSKGVPGIREVVALATAVEPLFRPQKDYLFVATAGLLSTALALGLLSRCGRSETSISWSKRAEGRGGDLNRFGQEKVNLWQAPDVKYLAETDQVKAYEELFSLPAKVPSWLWKVTKDRATACFPYAYNIKDRESRMSQLPPGICEKILEFRGKRDYAATGSNKVLPRPVVSAAFEEHIPVSFRGRASEGYCYYGPGGVNRIAYTAFQDSIWWWRQVAVAISDSWFEYVKDEWRKYLSFGSISGGKSPGLGEVPVECSVQLPLLLSPFSSAFCNIQKRLGPRSVSSSQIDKLKALPVDERVRLLYDWELVYRCVETEIFLRAQGLLFEQQRALGIDGASPLYLKALKSHYGARGHVNWKEASQLYLAAWREGCWEAGLACAVFDFYESAGDAASLMAFRTLSALEESAEQGNSLLRKQLVAQLRSHFNEVKATCWQYSLARSMYEVWGADAASVEERLTQLEKAEEEEERLRRVKEITNFEMPSFAKRARLGLYRKGLVIHRGYASGDVLQQPSRNWTGLPSGQAIV